MARIVIRPRHPAPAKVISLSVRPLEASHLCFNVDGIVGDAVLGSDGNPVASLGASVAPALAANNSVPRGSSAVLFPFDAFYKTLTNRRTTGGDDSVLYYDANNIVSHTKPYTLATLRAEGRKLALRKAINARQNAFYAKYGARQQTEIINKMNEYYSAKRGNSKPKRLAILSEMADQQWSDLDKQYKKDERTGVVKTTSITSLTNNVSGGFVENVKLVGGGFPTPPQTQNWNEALAPADVSLTQESSGGSSTLMSYGYRVPSIEDRAKNERAQISLIDQQFAQFMAGQTLPNLKQIFANELESIDMDVCRLQLAVLDTILMSPISGTITGVYKKPGDFVRAGEPVIRIEDSSTVLLVARLIFPGAIRLGDTVTTSTTALYEAIPDNEITGKVVAVRGQSEDDQWEVIVKYSNTGGGSFTLPLGYHFDYDDTTVMIS
jgi:hypothetical protein